MPSQTQELSLPSLQREVSRLSTAIDELHTALNAKDAIIAARDARIEQLEHHRWSFFWLVIVLAVMLIVAVATEGRGHPPIGNAIAIVM
jgi:hypothetical protein